MAISLHLQPPPPTHPPTTTHTRPVSLAHIETLIWRTLSALGCRSEARLWLCSALGSLPLTPHLRPSLFLHFILQSSTAPQLPARQLLRMICEKRPASVAQLLSGDSKLIRSFFSGHPKRILQWFENFSSTEKMEHQLGAQALAHFAFVHRDSCWCELEWKGPHGQAPATLASKPHYFLELDILRTVENFLDNVPTFWSSQELWDSLKYGELISMDTDFFVHTLHRRLFASDSSEVLHLVRSFLIEESFSNLCQRLLPLVDDRELLIFINELGSALSVSGEMSERGKGDTSSPPWLEQLLLSGASCSSVDDAILCNACVGYARQFRHIFQDEESEEEMSSLKRLIFEVNKNGLVEEKGHWEFRKHLLTLDKWVAIKWLALESWLIYILLAEDRMADSSLEALLVANGIQFRHKAYLSDGSWRRIKSRRDLKKGKDRERKRKKKRRKPLQSDSDERSSSDVERDCFMKDLKVKEIDNESWYFSTDNFMVAWNKVDIPEHLAGYAFGEWLKWLISQWQICQCI